LEKLKFKVFALGVFIKEKFFYDGHLINFKVRLLQKRDKESRKERKQSTLSNYGLLMTEKIV